MFKVTIDTNNAAFEDNDGHELARILREIAKKLERGEEAGYSYDINGNKVGEFGPQAV